MRNGTTLVVDLRSTTEVPAFYRGVYERELMRTCIAMLDADKVFVDAGANIGFYTTAGAKMIADTGGKGIVHAFEPHPGNFARLAHNVTINSLSKHCVLHPCGLSDCETDVDLVLREDFKLGSRSGNASIATSASLDRGYERIRIKVSPLDRIWCAHALFDQGRVSFVKVDVEGHEDFFLRGAQAVLNTDRPIILLEINQPYYKARGVDVDATIGAAVPANYRTCLFRGKRVLSASRLSEAGRVGNVFLVPCERLEWVRERCPAFRGLKA
jgi:FkbM family methyltransferase